MDTSIKIHSLTLGNNCFYNAISYEEIKELASFPEDFEDETLLKLTILHRLFCKSLDRKPCRKLIDICEKLIENGVVLKLIVLMHSDSRHVVFMSAKTLTGIFLFKPLLVEEFNLRKAFLNCLDFRWKAVYIMKMLTEIVANLFNGDMDNPQSNIARPPECTGLLSGKCHHSNSNSSVLDGKVMHDGNRCAKTISCECTRSITLAKQHHSDNHDSAMHLGRMMHTTNGDDSSDISTISNSCFDSVTQPCYHGNSSSVKLIGEILQDSVVVLSIYVSTWKDIFDDYRHKLFKEGFKCGNLDGIQKYQEFHMMFGSDMHQKLNDYQCMTIPKKIEHILSSFLQFLSTFLKLITHLRCEDISCKNLHDENSQDLILEMTSIRELLDYIPVFAYLLQAKGLSSEVLREIISLLSLCINTDNYTNKCGHFQRYSASLSCHVSTAVISSVTFTALDNIPLCSGFEGFGGQVIMLQSDSKVEFKEKPCCLVLRQLSLLILKSCLAFATKENSLNDSIKIGHVLKIWLELLMSKSPANCDKNLCRELMDFFVDQDDEMIRMMMLVLKLHKIFMKTTAHGFPITSINPHVMFIEFLAMVHYDHTVLLDFLVSCETAFLEYIMGYLQLVLHDWDGFFHQVNKAETDVMMTLISKDVAVDDDDHEVMIPMMMMAKDGNDSRMVSVLKGDTVCYGDEKKMRRTNDCNADDMSVMEDDADDKMMMIMTDDNSRQKENCKDSDVGLGCLSAIMETYGSSDDDDSCNNEDYGGGDNSDYDNNYKVADDGGNTIVDYGDDDNDDDNDDGDGDDGDDDNGNNDIHKLSTKINPPVMKATCSSSILDKVMSTLIHLRISIQRLDEAGLYPYHARPLIKKLRSVENSYDGC